MSKNAQKIGWIGTGRMGLPMAERLLKAGHDVTVWNRTRAKAEPLAAKGGKIVDKLSELASCDVVFSIVSEGKDLEQVLFGKDWCRFRIGQDTRRLCRLLNNFRRGICRHPQEAQGAQAPITSPHQVSGNAKVHQGRPIVIRSFRGPRRHARRSFR
jgi:3-hydroxyisobutyrate dehydrogenase